MSRYRRRRPYPALIVLLVLGVTTIVVWSKVVHGVADVDTATRCNPPHTSGPGLGQVLPHDALDRTTPMPAAQARVRVLNASSQRGQATRLAESLQEFGFPQAADPDNDPLYPDGDLSCRGQLRFGANGAGAARTLSLLAPCFELVRDNRQDATVDMVVGKKFDQLLPNDSARKALDQLAAWHAQQPDQHGGQQAQGGQPAIDPALLAAARDAEC
ncbi:hypothetical protein GTS_45510 [Gandjariella thermophila]|uniref:LytR/CpsA/Psr regulator C-terminal domain-containing protein n=1 Tax=Gandjariella thermophila TaxID=1931992 RepID=A0A4D4JE47_9PSEU|nr:hypothetical protein GTS_45510 [Gandjariella thermophila]